MIHQSHSENHLLAALTVEEYKALHASLEHVSIAVREVLHRPGEQIRYIYFPLKSAASLLVTMADGSTVEVGVIGSEGMIGLCAFWGLPTTPHEVVVIIPDGAMRLPVDDLKKLLDHKGGAFHEMLLRYTHALVSCISQTAACNRLHTLDARLARWLLVTHDRSGQKDFPLTQEFMSEILGCRRSGVSVAAADLQSKGLIGYHRGHVSILDREGLEIEACECYEIVKQAFDSYLSSVTPQPTYRAALSKAQFTTLGDGVEGEIGTDLPGYNGNKSSRKGPRSETHPDNGQWSSPEMKRLYSYGTHRGVVYIAVQEGRFHALFEEHSLGSYSTPQQAAEDLAGGHTFTPPSGIDTATLDIPYDLSEWERLTE